MYLALKERLKKAFYKKPIIWPALERAQSTLYRWQHLWYYQLPGNQNRVSLKELHIEFASNCNLRCKFCSLDHAKPKQHITAETLEQVFTELRTNSKLKGIERIHLHNGGEILAHPKRIDMLKVIKKHKEEAKASGQKFPKIYLLTNGMLMREQVATEILNLEVVDFVGWSMDGGSPEDYEAMRLLAKWPKFFDNLKGFVALNQKANKPVKTFAITCIPDSMPIGIEWMDPEFQEALNMVDSYELRRLHNWGGEIDEVEAPPKSHKIGCDLLMQQMVVLPNGDVTVCCTDLNSNGVVGNLSGSSLEDIYRSPERREYIDKLVKGQKDQLELCKNCESF